jgi:hypothetical protein
MEGKIFIYTASECYESTVKLYKIEESLQNTKFARVSKIPLPTYPKCAA